jgi:hypothetical protein
VEQRRGPTVPTWYQHVNETAPNEELSAGLRGARLTQTTDRRSHHRQPIAASKEKAPLFPAGLSGTLAEWTGLEPATPGVTGRYSNRLNYHSASVQRLPGISGARAAASLLHQAVFPPR